MYFHELPMTEHGACVRSNDPVNFLPPNIALSRVCSLRDPCTHVRGLKKEKLGPRLTPPTESYVGKGFVSVVVPAYNEGDGIKLTLATIDEQAQV